MQRQFATLRLASAYALRDAVACRLSRAFDVAYEGAPS